MLPLITLDVATLFQGSSAWLSLPLTYSVEIIQLTY